MASITFSLEELVEILISNGLLPPNIVRIKVKGQSVHFVIKTNLFVLPFIPASLRYVRFDNNSAVFELTIISAYLKKAVNWFNELLRPKIPACMKLEYPNVFVDIEKLLNERSIKGVQVKDISFRDGEFAITTENASHAT
ncbi:MAG: hypothetical protein PVJ60_00155 [Phycisphaerales bacterium]|jgi:hypothetical protein